MRRGAKPAKDKVEPKLPVTRKSPKNDGARDRDLEKRLADALQREEHALKREAEAQEQQAATAEILRVISSSPTDVHPVFETIVRSAVRLCDGFFGIAYRYDNHQLSIVAHHNFSSRAIEIIARSYPAAASPESMAGRAVLRREVIHVSDVTTPGADAAPRTQQLGLELGYRAFLSVPMLRHGEPIGVINVTRREPRPFTDKQIDLVKTFADQAVIAIENVRLFNETKEALEQQTATSEILRVIASSPTEIQPVLDAVAESATRLCEAFDISIYRLEGDRLLLVAHHGPIPVLGRVGEFTLPLVRGTVAGRTILEARTVHIADVQTESEEFPESSENARRTGLRTQLSVPLMREGVAIGLITPRRTEARLFTERQVTLLQTFADQAVIAIENVRLFTELQEKNRQLTRAHGQVTEALERQMATSEILRVISSSPTDVQPVFNAIVESATRLCGARVGHLFRFDSELLYLVAGTSTPAYDDLVQRLYPMRPSRGQVSGRTILSRTVVQIPDVLTDPEYRLDVAVAGEWRSRLGVPLLRDGSPIGVIVIMRTAPGLFAEGHIELLKTFAEQAVIAIENVRLFKELEARTRELTRSVDELRALGEVGQAISSTLDLRTVLSTIVTRATQLSGTDAGVIYEYDDQREVFVPRATAHLEAEIVETMLATPVRKGEGATGRLAEVQEPIQLPNILEAPAESRVGSVLVRAGYRALLAVPLVREDRLLGGLTVFRKTPGEFAPEVVDLLRTFATQSALAIQNARLFLEIEDKSRQLEAASQHKSEFLANMSHELRTPLNAIIGFSEVLSERMFGDLNEKQDEYLKDIYASGTHLLSLINDILDLSKIEAGRMELELTDFHLPQAIDNALTLVRERAGRRGIALHHSVEQHLGEIRGDERKVKQVLLNLLSNALKFTPEGGRVEVLARVVGGMAEISVTDTGVGIAAEDQEAVFEEFRQVGMAEKKAEGTGLGLTLCRKFIELHGGKIWVTSQVGVGSTFTFTIPVRRSE